MMSPEGGTIVVYDCSAMEAWKDLADCDKRKLCRHDGYRWSRMKGDKVLANGPYRCYNFLYDKDDKSGSNTSVPFAADTDSVSLQIEQDWSSFIMLVIIKMTANAPHGNARKNAQPYIRTLPATRHDIRRSLLVTHYVAEMTLSDFQAQLVDGLSTVPVEWRGEVRAKIEHELDVLFAQKVAAEVAQLFDESARESVMERLLAMVADESSS
ncbi:unnamed protein product [Toxocara canis]|uniref:CPSF_A domain-containing protein n=1 Tax=Toxocara canis TaxID=6265 RepID=A0A183V6B4_TOXCA|nr:unnamed protein product [Toxocara canis]